MGARTTRMLVVMLTLAAMAAPAMAQVITTNRVMVEAPVRTTSVGEPVEVRLIVLGVGEVEAPGFTAGDAVDVELVDESHRTHTTVEVVGRKQRPVVYTRSVFVYEVTPRAHGTLTIPPFRVDTGDGIATTSPVRIRVERARRDRDFMARVSTETTRPFVGQLFEVDLTLYVKRQFRGPRLTGAEVPRGVEVMRPDRGAARRGVRVPRGRPAGGRDHRRGGGR